MDKIPGDPFHISQKKKTIARDEELFNLNIGFNNRDRIVKYIKKQSIKKGRVNYIEIGVKLGSTFRYVLDKTKELNIYGYGIDLFEDFELDKKNTHFGDVASMSIMDKKLREMGYNNFELIKGDSSTMIRTRINKMRNGVVFIDGNHTYEGVKKDFEEIKKKLSDSIIIFDDYDWPGVKRYVDEIKNGYKILERHNRYFVIKLD